MTNEASTPVWQRPYSAFGMTKPTGVLKATPNPKAAITNKPVLLKATNPAQELNIRESSQYEDGESGMRYNLMRTLLNGHRYSQSDPIGLDGGWNRFVSVGGNPVMSTDPTGLQVPLPPVPVPVPGVPSPTNPLPSPIDPTEPGGPTYTPGLPRPDFVISPSPMTLPLMVMSMANQLLCEKECDPPKGTVCYFVDLVPNHNGLLHSSQEAEAMAEFASAFAPEHASFFPVAVWGTTPNQ